jgi:hypothetical protein
MRPNVMWIFLAPAVAVGCGGDDDDGGGGAVDAGVRSDGGPDSGGDPDAGLDCAIEASYGGETFDARAFIGNPNNPSLRFLALNANLEPGSEPDRLVIAAFDSAGIETGTFALDGSKWSVSLCVDFDPDRFAVCRESINARGPGALTISSIEDRLTGSLVDAEFASADQPGCEAVIESVEFDELIE